MRRVIVLTSLALTLQLLSQVEATDRWPQFRGSDAGVADDDPALPDAWSETEYVGADRSGLGILDVGGSGTPTLRGSLKTPGQAKSVSVSDGMALVTDTVAGVGFIRIQDPAGPTLTGSAFLDGFSTDVVANGNWAYAADRPTGFYVFDLSKKDPFEAVGTTQSGSPNNTQRAQLEVLPESSGRRPGRRRTPAVVRCDESRQPDVVAAIPHARRRGTDRAEGPPRLRRRRAVGSPGG